VEFVSDTDCDATNDDDSVDALELVSDNDLDDTLLPVSVDALEFVSDTVFVEFQTTVAVSEVAFVSDNNANSASFPSELSVAADAFSLYVTENVATALSDDVAALVSLIESEKVTGAG
jgi:hypothetical protein